MRIIPIITAVIVAIGLYAVVMERDALRAWAADDADAAQAAPEAAEAQQRDRDAPVSVVALLSTARPVQSGLVLSGRTEAARKVEIRAETTGQVTSEPIRKGQPITEGDLLCQLDPGTRNATLAEARARLTEAESNFSTASRLAERGFGSENDIIARQVAVESAQAAIEQAEKELSRIEIRAPFTGILETDTAELGSLLQPGSACATLISLDPIHVVAFVPEQEIGRLTLNAPARANLITGQTLDGSVSFLSRSADEVTRTFRVEVRVDNPALSIRDGVTAELMIGLDGEKAHLLPQSAMTLNDEGQLGVRVNEDGVAKFMPVSMIRDEADGVWLAGLPETVEVIVVGQDFVTDGRAIDVSYRETNG